MSAKFKPRDRITRPDYKFLTEVEADVVFTWKQRIQILCGYRGKMKTKIASEHSGGKFQSMCDFETTKELKTKPNDHHR
jgi:hypothetical protein